MTKSAFTTGEALSPTCAACPAPRGCFPAPCGLHWQRQAFKAIEERNKFSAEAADLTVHHDAVKVKLQTALNHIAYLLPLAIGYAARHPDVLVNQNIIRDAGAFSGSLVWGGSLPDPRDADQTREGVFRDHNCWKCDNGRKPCVKGKGNERDCDSLHARND